MILSFRITKMVPEWNFTEKLFLPKSISKRWAWQYYHTCRFGNNLELTVKEQLSTQINLNSFVSIGHKTWVYRALGSQKKRLPGIYQDNWIDLYFDLCSSFVYLYLRRANQFPGGPVTSIISGLSPIIYPVSRLKTRWVCTSPAVK